MKSKSETRDRGVDSRHSARFRLLDRAAMASALLLLGWLAVEATRAVSALTWWAAIAVVVTAFAVAYVAADFVSGFVHFLADRFGSETTPIVGAKLIAPFREHHALPLAMTEHDFAETNGDSALVAHLVLVPAVFTMNPASSLVATWSAVFVGQFVVLVLATNQIHKWAHSRRVPRAVRTLQRLRWILHPAEHARHHRVPYRSNYCIFAGVLNAPLESVDLFGRTEKVLRWVIPARWLAPQS